ncbi:MAG: GNAT family N-acetyltransferase [Pseudomonadota bacterium]
MRLETDRTVLSLLHERDAQAIAEYYRVNAAHLDPWEPARPAHFHDAKSWRQRARKAQLDAREGTSLRLVARLKEANEIIGVCNFTNVQRGPAQSAYLGYSIAAAYQRIGLMSEIVDAGCTYMLGEAGLHRIQAACIPKNARSAKLLEKLGFRMIGRAEKYLQIKGTWMDHNLWQRLAPQITV